MKLTKKGKRKKKSTGYKKKKTKNKIALVELEEKKKWIRKDKLIFMNLQQN